MSYNSQYIITHISASNAEATKGSGVEQIPVIFTIPGVLSIKNTDTPYTVTVGTKKIR
jgi:hypothetical protein